MQKRFLQDGYESHFDFRDWKQLLTMKDASNYWNIIVEEKVVCLKNENIVANLKEDILEILNQGKSSRICYRI